MNATHTEQQPQQPAVTPDHAARFGVRVKGFVCKWIRFQEFKDEQTGEMKRKGGFGFISVQGWEDVFVHSSAIDGYTRDRALHPGQCVEFLLQRGPKGFEAVDVKVVRP